MAGTLAINNIQLGDSLTASQNFVLKTNSDGTATLARGNVGSTSQDILTVNSAGKVTLLDMTTTLQDGLPTFACRAWVNFDGTRNVTNTGASTNGQPVFIRASGNVTSVIKNGTGDYTINFTTAMPDIDYSVLGTCRQPSGSAAVINPHTASSVNQAPTVNNFRITARAVASSPVVVDADYVMISVIR